MKIMISACLIGENCKYNGGNNASEAIAEYIKGHTVIPVCPEVMGGLLVPRTPCEIVGGEVKTGAGLSCDREYRLGAQKALEIAKKEKVDLVILQPRSPSCGSGLVYDGTFSGKLIEGDGIFAAILKENGFHIINAADICAKRRK